MRKSLFPQEIQKKAKHCFECGICTASCPIVELLPAHYNPRTLLYKAFTKPEKILSDKGLWLCAWCYRCHRNCPQDLKPPEILQTLKNEAVKMGLFNGLRNATQLIRENVPLPGICWHACFHHDRAKISNDELERNLEKLTTQKEKSKGTEEFDKSVAIIGSGPAGLTAAFELAEIGYSVSIFEALPEAGGMLRKSMPQFRLPTEILDAEISRLRGLGVQIKTKTTVGKDIDFNDLWKAGYKAVFIATGAHEGAKLGIKGENLKGVIDALDFLWKVKAGQKIQLGRKIGVVGGGNVAIDSARVALREGADEVVVIYRRTKDEMPANPWEVTEAENEGVRIEYLTTPVSVLEKNGKAAGLQCLRMSLGEVDETGRRSPIPIENSEFTIELDSIIVAIGERPEITFLPNTIEVGKGNKISVNPVTMETSMEGVFAGGDAVTGPATVIEAVVAGKQAAKFIDQHLAKMKREGKHRGN